MASQTDAVTPQQKSSILQSYGDGSDSRLSKVAASFTEAFDRVFSDEEREEEAVTLRDVLLLDESVDSVIDLKKNLKDTPSQAKHSEEGMTVESFLEIYSLLGCTICSSHSCEHGEYGAKNERQRFSLEADGFAQLRGKSKSLMVGKSTIEGCGYGLFTTEDVQQGDFVVEYVGELISQDEGVRREARRGDPFDNGPKSSYLFTLLDKEGIWVDAAIYGNLSRFINHQENDEEGGGPNIMPQIVYSGGEYRIKFAASRGIRAGDELFFDYGKEFPNLTKKMLDEKNAEEVNKRKSHSEEVAQEPAATTSETAPNPGRKRRGRPRKTPRDASREEAAEASDTSSTDLISRRRVKKRPARYDD
ncbi:hypothetical protein KJ359_013133 [Pestalotiopsis sp. 9143b]|nr:hypothetical protein KJ359_013133 [Pestalotiopsis sp. 9143b]